ncbi:MAG: cysteine desulfurase [Oscillospiraceae bacterium]|nr:cysteine desulfurase [Oscillospiraceae bacterium]
MIYLDNAATTRTDDNAALTALEIMRGDYGNPSSLHGMGFAAKKRLDTARAQVAAALGCADKEIVFTSGGTEANNLAIFGGAEALKRRGNHIVTSGTEHSSVLSPAAELERRGFSVSRTAAQEIAGAVTDKTILVTCMMANSETGALTDIAKLAAMIRHKSKLCLIHCDAVQAFGKLPFSVRDLGVDLLSVSAHKIHGAKGCGALYAAKRVMPQMFGGKQENSLRPGTQPLPGICAFGAAAENAYLNMAANLEKVGKICGYFEEKAANFPGLCINSPAISTPYIRSISLPGFLSAHLVNSLSAQGICVSGGSACSGGGRSHVLEFMGLENSRIDSALRISFSKYTTEAEIDAFFDALAHTARTLAKG